MQEQIQQTSAFRSWLLILALVAIVVFQGWFVYSLIGDLGQPDWDYRPIPDVPGQSAYAISEPYHALPYPQHVRGKQGSEGYPTDILRFSGAE